MVDEIQMTILEQVADLHAVPEGAYNIRANGQTASRNTTANIDIVSKGTQEQFAEKISMSVQGYRNIEHNRYLPTAETIDKICEVFNIQPVELLLPEPQANLDKVRELINNKLCNCNLDKLIRINNMIDLM